MSDRSHAYVLERTEDTRAVGTFIYVHWLGERLPGLIAEGLRTAKAGGRLEDGPYLTRILIDSVSAYVRDSAGTEVTGIGVSALPNDNDGYPILVVDVERGVVVQSRYPDPLAFESEPMPIPRWLATSPDHWELSETGTYRVVSA